MRWAPSERQLADSMTKDSSEACNLLRSTLRRGVYVLAEETSVLEAKKAERERRLEMGRKRAAAAEAADERRS